MWTKNLVLNLASRFGPHCFSGSAPRLWIMMYHRVLPIVDIRYATEEPGMIVTPDTFRQHLRELKRLFTVLPLSEWVERHAAGKVLPQRACAITFDDGWLDNFEYALPILQQEQVPATVFAVSHMIGTDLIFWPNRLARLLQLDSRHGSLNWLKRFAGYQDDGALGRETSSLIIKSCKQFSDKEIQQKLDIAEAQLKLPKLSSHSLMNWDQLRTVQKSGLMDVGSHTCHHYRLTEALSEDTMTQEIIESRNLLERELDQPVKLFCYPNGDVSPSAVRLVRETYSAAVTTKRGINSAGLDMHMLQRIGVHEDVSHTPMLLRARLSGWL